MIPSVVDMLVRLASNENRPLTSELHLGEFRNTESSGGKKWWGRWGGLCSKGLLQHDSAFLGMSQWTSPCDWLLQHFLDRNVSFLQIYILLAGELNQRLREGEITEVSRCSESCKSEENLAVDILNS